MSVRASSAKSVSPERKGTYFRGQMEWDNNSSARWLTMKAFGVSWTGGQETVGQAGGNVFLPPSSEQFSYDLDGNLTSDSRWNYSWDAENRLVRMATKTSIGPARRIDFEYDSKGRRIRKTVWDNTGGSGNPITDVTFVYDGWNPIAELDGSHGLVRSYMWGLDLSGTHQGAGGIDGLLEVSDASQGNHFVAFDGNGNVMALVKASDGTPSAQYEYGPFGELIRAGGAMAASNPLRFSTKYQDDETDLVALCNQYPTAVQGGCFDCQF